MSSPFKGKAVNNSGGGSEVPSADTHPAALVALVDLGTHDEEYQGKSKSQRKVYLVWELTAEKMSGSEHNHVIGKEYTLSFHKKAGLRAVAEAVRGQPYPEDAEIDYTKMIGVPCLVTVEHAQSAAGNTYAKVEGVTRPTKGMSVAKPRRAPFCWSVDGGSEEELRAADWLPYLFGEEPLAKAKRSHEWRGQAGGAPDRRPGGDAEAVGAGVGGAEEEIPF